MTQSYKSLYDCVMCRCEALLPTKSGASENHRSTTKLILAIAVPVTNTSTSIAQDLSRII